MKKKRKRRLRKSLRNILIILVCLMAGFFGYRFMRSDFPEAYDSTLFQNTSDGYKFYNNENVVSRIGIDVSQHNGTVDWQSVADTRVEFAIIRLGYRGAVNGELHLDPSFMTNLEQARAAGLQVGVYWFSSAIDQQELQEEADFVLEQLNGVSLDLGVTYDMEFFDADEGRINSLTQEEKTDLALAFCQAMEQGGYTSMIYGNLDWLTNQLDFERIRDRTLWYAAYQDQPSMDSFAIWQYSNSGTLPGITGPVDMNLWLVPR